jgi:CarD family transcriptional regulator
MKLSVGDRVMHPIHGVGRVVDITHQELVEGFEHYYVIEIPAKRLTMHIPTDKIDEAEVRPITPNVEQARVLNVLCSAPDRLPKNVTKREELVREKIRTGHSIQIAEAVRDLRWVEEASGLTQIEMDLLEWGQALLAAEIALLTNTEIANAHKKLSAILKDAPLE